MLYHFVRAYYYSCRIEHLVFTETYAYFRPRVQSRLERAIRWGLELTFQDMVVYPVQKTFRPLTPLSNHLPLHPTKLSFPTFAT